MKMNESQSFFSDPKVIISIFALLISIGNFLWSLANQFEQNRRWEELNTGNPKLKEVKFLNRKELSLEEAKNIDWGYRPLIYSKDELQDNYVLPYCLIAKDSVSKIPLKINTVFTIKDVEAELHRIGFNGKYLAFRLFRPIFYFENMGKTEIKNFGIKIQFKNFKGDWEIATEQKVIANLAAGQTCNTFLDFELPVSAEIPPDLTFKVILSYMNINSNKFESEIGVKWINENNYWTYEPIAPSISK